MTNFVRSRFKPGDTVGRWTLVRYDRVLKPGKTWVSAWWCKCQCGTERHVSEHVLRYGRSNSCGCLKMELNRARKGNTWHKSRSRS